MNRGIDSYDRIAYQLVAAHVGGNFAGYNTLLKDATDKERLCRAFTRLMAQFYSAEFGSETGAKLSEFLLKVSEDDRE